MKDHRELILIIEDEKNIADFVETVLNSRNYKVIKAYTGKEALSAITSHCPDVILLDLGLPDMDGLDIIKQVREWAETPIVVISARTQEKEKVAALDLGADDYITKPFGTDELMARIRTALRHHDKAKAGNSSEKYQVEGLEIDFGKRLVMLEGQSIHLTQIEYKLITLLAKNAGKVLTYDHIMKEIWGPYAGDDNQILRVNMANIRRKLEKNPAEPKYIFTEVGVGYRMQEDR
ncbi:DNA-binding response regulator [Lactonifactor longoviformis]|uniref:Stage 0 sporulation protein A homolog n=1 Tax=Lactonifactor longoviformis DSM 17459 TaxID=1122155 RepID=A0A1M5C3P0_9CLOT|nr:response regulator transcription factor [Lactonifactor longoviformis]POP31746.1 DNA-binding response regulator [Lactonifactor longoviformis]SHF49227.1 two-component system, OmpR family, KDP operon response regulator KdpE [Lactonifactor longoviformis DSM 17459]